MRDVYTYFKRKMCTLLHPIQKNKQQYFLAKEQYFFITRNEHKPNFSKTNRAV